MLHPFFTAYVRRKKGGVTKDRDLDLDANVGGPQLILLLNVREARGFMGRIVVPVWRVSTLTSQGFIVLIVTVIIKHNNTRVRRWSTDSRNHRSTREGRFARDLEIGRDRRNNNRLSLGETPLRVRSVASYDSPMIGIGHAAGRLGRGDSMPVSRAIARVLCRPRHAEASRWMRAWVPRKFIVHRVQVTYAWCDVQVLRDEFPAVYSILTVVLNEILSRLTRDHP